MFTQKNILTVLLLLPIVLLAQTAGKPLVRHFAGKEFSGHPQTWAILTDNNGLMYFGNQEGIIEYDGQTWRTIRIPNHSTVRAMCIDKNQKIFVGAIGEFGYLKQNKIGALEYISLSDKLDTTISKFADVWNVVSHDNSVFFLTDNYLYRHFNDTTIVIKPNGKYLYSLFSDTKNLFLHDFNFGITIYNGNTFNIMPGSQALADKGLHSIWETRQKGLFLVGLRNSGLFLLDTIKQDIKPLNNNLNINLQQNKLYYATLLSNNNIAIATINSGLIITDSAGNIIETINKNKGLKSQTVYYLLEHNQQLWAGTDNGISIIDYKSPIRYWDETDGVTGNINDIIVFNNNIYFATSTGVYCLLANDNYKKAVNVSGISGQAWDITTFKASNGNNHLLIGASEGLFIINELKAKLIYKSSAIFKVSCSKQNPNHIYIGTNNSLSLLKLNNNLTINHSKIILQTDRDVREIFEDTLQNIWLGVNYTGIYKIQNALQINNTKPSITRYGHEKGFDFERNNLIFTLGNDIVFASEKGFYTYLPTTDTFVTYTKATNWLNGYKPDGLIQIVQNKNEYWIDVLSRVIELNENYFFDTVTTIPLRNITTNSQYIDNNGNYYIGSNSAIYKINKVTQLPPITPFNTLIREVSICHDSILYNGHGVSTNKVISYKNKLLRFIYTATDYQNPEKLLYSYKLVGYDNNWSEWTDETRKEYTNLYEGDYLFMVRAKNSLGVIGKSGSFSFTVSAPVYRKWYAFLAYLLSAFIIVYVFVHLKTRKLVRDKTKLNSIIDERTTEIRQQKEEIQASAENLKMANNELEKLSVIAQKTDNAVAVFDNSGNIEWINQGFTNLYGYTLNEYIKQKGINILESGTNLNIAQKIHNCIDNKETTIYEFFTLTKKMQGVWIQTTLTPILDENNNLHKLIAIDSDITKLKNAEIKIQKQRDELKKANDTKDKFFSIIAHDLRGPLSNIFTMLNVLNNNIENLPVDNLKKTIAQITDTTGNTYNLTENLLDWARLQKDNIKYKPLSININSLVLETIELLQTQANKKNLIVNTFFDDEFLVFADEEMVKTILRNLLSNAIKFTPDNGNIAIKTADCDKYVCLIVSDTGMGISNAEQQNLFRLDVNNSKTGTNNEKGTGLGLILVKEFVERNLGSIKIDSRVNKGTTITVTLPRVHQ